MAACNPRWAFRADHGLSVHSPDLFGLQLKGEGVDTRGPFSRPPYPSNRLTLQQPAVRSIVLSGGQKPPFERQPSSGSWPTSVALVWLLPDACEPLRAQLNALKARGTLRFHLLTVMEAQDEKLRPDDPPRSQTMLLERQVRWPGSVSLTNHPARASSPSAKCRESSHFPTSPRGKRGRQPSGILQLVTAC